MEGTMITTTTKKPYLSAGDRTMPLMTVAAAEASTVEPECFQDLASWCPSAQDELNTPKNLQDEFNFSVDGQGRDCTWSYSSPVDLDNDLWETPDHLPSPALTVDEDNNMDTNCFLPTLDQQPDYFTIDDTTKDDFPVRPNGNLLLSQTGFQGISQNEAGGSNVLQQKKEISPAVHNVEPRHKPDLKLNISIAPMAAMPPQVHSFSSVKCELTLDTPDVVKSFNDEASGFDLLSFVNGDLEERPQTSLADPVVIKTDHDYAESRKEAFNVKTEPLSPAPPPPTTPSETSPRQAAKRRLTSSSEDYTFDEDVKEDDDSVDWLPSKSRRKVKPRKKSSSSSGTSRGTAAKKPRLSSADCDPEVVTERYRELRNKNNEASRKSRLNRKQKEVEMTKLAEKLQLENEKLIVKAKSLDKLVVKLRETLLSSVFKK